MPKLFIIMDGIGDRPCRKLNNKTPLEAAKTPNLDIFTKYGCLGYVYPVSPKVAPESDVGVTALLGYDPYKYYTGRGPLEAVGAGLKLPEEFIALRANFASVIGNKLVDRRCGRTLTSKEAMLLEDAVNSRIKLKHKFQFKATSGHRGVLIIKGKFSDNISNIDPAYKKEGVFGVAEKEFEEKIPECTSLDSKKITSETAEIINDFISKSHKVLSEENVNKKRIRKKLLPANFIVLRDAGISLPKLPKKHGWAAVTGMPLEKGIAELSGMAVLEFKYPEIRMGNVKRHQIRSLKFEIKNSLKYIKENKFGSYYVHFKQTDIPGHDGDPITKKKMIEILDKRFFKKLRKIKKLNLIVTGDHSTPCNLRAHSSDPVPLLWFGKEKDNTKRFTERQSKKGKIGKLLGKAVLENLK